MSIQASVSLVAAAAAAVRRDAHDPGTGEKPAPPAPPKDGSIRPPLREHAWRDLVRRLEKTLPHRKPVSG